VFVEKKGGACIQCDDRRCTASFHPQCARLVGLEMKQASIRITVEGEEGRYIIYCKNHRKTPPKYPHAVFYAKDAQSAASLNSTTETKQEEAGPSIKTDAEFKNESVPKRVSVTKVKKEEKKKNI